jgi:hypothetical protein
MIHIPTTWLASTCLLHSFLSFSLFFVLHQSGGGGGPGCSFVQSRLVGIPAANTRYSRNNEMHSAPSIVTTTTRTTTTDQEVGLSNKNKEQQQYPSNKKKFFRAGTKHMDTTTHPYVGATSNSNVTSINVSEKFHHADQQDGRKLFSGKTVIPIGIGQGFAQFITDNDLMRGFKTNVPRGNNPLQPKVFDGTAFNAPASNVKTYSRIIQNSEDIKDYLSIEGSLSISYGIASGSVSGNFLENKIKKSNSVTIVYRDWRVAYQKTVSDLTPVNAVQGLRLDEIADRYGTKFVDTIYYGAQLEVEYELSSSENSEKMDIGGEIKGKIESAILKGDLQVAANVLKEESAKAYSMQVRAKSIGVNLNIPGNPSLDNMVQIINDFQDEYTRLIDDIRQLDNVDGDSNVLNRIAPVAFSLDTISSYIPKLNAEQTALLDSRMDAVGEMFYDTLYQDLQIKNMLGIQKEKFESIDNTRIQTEIYQPYFSAVERVQDRLNEKKSEYLAFRNLPFKTIVDPQTVIPDKYPKGEYEHKVIAGILGEVYIPAPVVIGTTTFDSMYFEGFAIPDKDQSIKPSLRGSLRYVADDTLAAKADSLAELEVEGIRALQAIEANVHDYLKYQEGVYIQSLSEDWLRTSYAEHLVLEGTFENKNGLWKFHRSLDDDYDDQVKCVRYGDTVYLQEQTSKNWLGNNYFGVSLFQEEKRTEGPFYYLEPEDTIDMALDSTAQIHFSRSNEEDVTCQGLMWPRDYEWSYHGTKDGYDCIQVYEHAEPHDHTWFDNYFCWKKSCKGSLGIKWSQSGPISGMRCTQIYEPLDQYTWTDNYLCVPYDSNLFFEWYHNEDDIPKHLRCIQWFEGSDPQGWDNNYLCANSVLSNSWSTLDVPGIPDTGLSIKEVQFLSDHLRESYQKDEYLTNLKMPLKWVVEGEANSHGECVQKMGMVRLRKEYRQDQIGDMYLSSGYDEPVVKSSHQEASINLQWTIRSGLESDHREPGFTCGAISVTGKWQPIYTTHHLENDGDENQIVEYGYGFHHSNQYPYYWQNNQSWRNIIKATVSGNLTVYPYQNSEGTLIDNFYAERLIDSLDDAIACKYPIWPNDYEWSDVDIITGKQCVKIHDKQYLCWKNTCNENNPGLKWSEERLPDMRCTHIYDSFLDHELKFGANRQSGNYLCTSYRSLLSFKWYPSGEELPKEETCIPWLSNVESPSSSHLCARRDHRSSTSIPTGQQAWEFVYNFEDECVDSWHLRTATVAFTESVHFQPCCLPGFEEDPFTTAHGPCKLLSPCFCDESVCNPMPTGSPSSYPTSTPTEIPSSSPTLSPTNIETFVNAKVERGNPTRLIIGISAGVISALVSVLVWASLKVLYTKKE